MLLYKCNKVTFENNSVNLLSLLLLLYCECLVEREGNNERMKERGRERKRKGMEERNLIVE